MDNTCNEKSDYPKHIIEACTEHNAILISEKGKPAKCIQEGYVIPAYFLNQNLRQNEQSLAYYKNIYEKNKKASSKEFLENKQKDLPQYVTWLEKRIAYQKTLKLINPSGDI